MFVEILQVYLAIIFSAHAVHENHSVFKNKIFDLLY